MEIIFISHRGNIVGKVESCENEPTYIDTAIEEGYDVEVDIWYTETSQFFLGHDTPQYEIPLSWLLDRAHKLWIHCKNVKAMEWFNVSTGFNYFWHEEDTVTLTSNGSVWAYPGMQPIKNSIAVLPEINNDDVTKCKGICSDYIETYRKWKPQTISTRKETL